jgi:predicted AAA+ superfamily ATPase
MLNPRGGLSERLAGSSNLVAEAFSGYKAKIPWLKLTLRFRDRVGEAPKLVNPPYIANPMMILYGPVGCGKSEIARALLYIVLFDIYDILFDTENMDRDELEVLLRELKGEIEYITGESEKLKTHFKELLARQPSG